MPYTQLQGRRIFYQWYGEVNPERETVIFLHDGLGTVGAWKNLPAQLARKLGLNAMAYDRYGYGRSQPRGRFPFAFMEAEPPALLELMDALSLEKVHLVGHSDGASIALLFAARHPERVRSLVSVAAHTFVEDCTLQGIQALLDAMSRGQSPCWLKRLHQHRAEALLRAWGGGWLSRRHKAWNIESWLGFVKCPTLVVQGTEDEFGSEAQVISILNRVENCEQWMAEGCGHSPQNDKPRLFAERIGAFLLGQSPG